MKMEEVLVDDRIAFYHDTEELTSPDSSVCSVACSVEGKAQDDLSLIIANMELEMDEALKNGYPTFE